jgi:hypothetical protein
MSIYDDVLQFYWEEFQGSYWTPVAAPDRPAVKNGRLHSQSNGVGSEIRNLREIAPEHRKFPLDALQAVYGTRP